MNMRIKPQKKKTGLKTGKNCNIIYKIATFRSATRHDGRDSRKPFSVAARRRLPRAAFGGFPY